MLIAAQQDLADILRLSVDSVRHSDSGEVLLSYAILLLGNRAARDLSKTCSSPAWQSNEQFSLTLEPPYGF